MSEEENCTEGKGNFKSERAGQFPDSITCSCTASGLLSVAQLPQIVLLLYTSV